MKFLVIIHNLQYLYCTNLQCTDLALKNNTEQRTPLTQKLTPKVGQKKDFFIDNQPEGDKIFWNSYDKHFLKQKKRKKESKNINKDCWEEMQPREANSDRNKSSGLNKKARCSFNTDSAQQEANSRNNKQIKISCYFDKDLEKEMVESCLDSMSNIDDNTFRVPFFQQNMPQKRYSSTDIKEGMNLGNSNSFATRKINNSTNANYSTSGNLYYGDEYSSGIEYELIYNKKNDSARNLDSSKTNSLAEPNRLATNLYESVNKFEEVYLMMPSSSKSIKDGQSNSHGSNEWDNYRDLKSNITQKKENQEYFQPNTFLNGAQASFSADYQPENIYFKSQRNISRETQEYITGTSKDNNFSMSSQDDFLSNIQKNNSTEIQEKQAFLSQKRDILQPSRNLSLLACKNNFKQLQTQGFSKAPPGNILNTEDNLKEYPAEISINNESVRTLNRGQKRVYIGDGNKSQIKHKIIRANIDFLEQLDIRTSFMVSNKFTNLTEGVPLRILIMESIFLPERNYAIIDCYKQWLNREKISIYLSDTKTLLHLISKILDSSASIKTHYEFCLFLEVFTNNHSLETPTNARCCINDIIKIILVFTDLNNQSFTDVPYQNLGVLSGRGMDYITTLQNIQKLVNLPRKEASIQTLFLLLRQFMKEHKEFDNKTSFLDRYTDRFERCNTYFKELESLSTDKRLTTEKHNRIANNLYLEIKQEIRSKSKAKKLINIQQKIQELIKMMDIYQLYACQSFLANIIELLKLMGANLIYNINQKMVPYENNQFLGHLERTIDTGEPLSAEYIGELRNLTGIVSHVAGAKFDFNLFFSLIRKLTGLIISRKKILNK